MDGQIGIFVVVIIICLALIALSIWMLKVSIGSMKKKQKLIAACDAYHKSTIGSYTYEYMIKAYDEYGKKVLKVVIQPTYGMDAFKNAMQNGWLTCDYVIENLSEFAIQTINFASDSNSLYKTDFTIDLEEQMINPDGSLNLKINISSSWAIAGNIIKDDVTLMLKK